MNRYLIAGLTIETELELPFGLGALEGGTPDASISERDVPARLSDAAVSGPCWELSEGRFLLTVPGVVRCLVEDGRRINFQSLEGAGHNDVVPFVLGTSLAILLHQRGAMVFQASAVAVDGRAVLFAGPSISGKSTIAGVLSREGYTFVCDDLCVVDFDAAGLPFVHADGAMLRLWGKCIAALGLDDRRGARVRASVEKYYVRPVVESAQTRYPLGAFYRLRWAGSAPTRVEAVTPARAVLQLRHSTYASRYVGASGNLQRQFEQVTRLGRRVDVFEFWRTLDFGLLPVTLQAITTHWRDRALIERSE